MKRRAPLWCLDMDKILECAHEVLFVPYVVNTETCVQYLVEIMQPSV